MVLLAHDEVQWAARPRWPVGPLWQGRERGEALEAIATLLERAPRSRLGYLERVDLLLGYPHVHYLLLPWQEGLYSDLDWQGFAMALFGQHHDLDPTRWQVAVDPAPFGQARLAAAVGKELLEALQALLRARRLPIGSCRPLLVDALRRHWRQLPADYRFVVREADAVSCLLGQQGLLEQVCVLPVAPRAALSEALLMVEVLCDVAERQTLVVAPRQERDSPSHWLGSLHPWLAEPTP
ncbi:hypothetical protein HU752_030200 [Pseudomonas vanderleydeniana]|uniref:Uncharacterized protein n=1 Tax=Pseudomonas vanderleydeniana TaxID=2745495 RepID=A0A9E6PT05_9PSED|nr:hypothetical protein HU752_030200 [Pseudomonas vanderleydeniana]